ncbi:MAG: methyltransferase domain-containing protein [bacterium]
MSDSSRERWQKRYLDEDLPWDTGKPDRHLLDLVTVRPLKPCRALEVGCGTGTNALWLASQGFEVTAVDIASEAIVQARAKITENTSGIIFLDVDFLSDNIDGGPFGFAYDRGCFHSFDQPDAAPGSLRAWPRRWNPEPSGSA